MDYLKEDKTKFCNKCKTEKSLDLFYLDKYSRDGKHHSCILCAKKWRETHKEQKAVYNKKYQKENKDYNKKYQQEHKEEIKKQRHEHYLKIKTKVNEQHRNYYLQNREKLISYSKKHYLNNKEQISVQKKKYQEKHKEETKIYLKKYYQEHKEQVNAYTKNKRKTDINFRIMGNLRNRVVSVVNNNRKSLSTMILLGCEIDYFLLHIQSQFTEGMSWDNYGTGFNGNGLKQWHIDHRVPCASFDLSKPEEQQKCFHYTNLQPLWALDNLSKGSKLINSEDYNV